VYHFLDEFAQKKPETRHEGRPGSHAAADELPWYGNVRELKNLIERIVVLKDGDTLQAEDLRKRSA